MTERAHQHGTGVVVFQPAGVGGEGAALFDSVAEFEEAVVRHFQHTNHAPGIMHLGQYVLGAFAGLQVVLVFHQKARHGE
jgi:hypothetical protein